MKLGVALFLLFTIVPSLETWLIIKVGSEIGATETVASLLFAGFLGAWLGRRAGFAVLRQIVADLQQGLPPADRVVEAALVLVGSVLLITPGYLSDVAGLLFFIAPVRRALAPVVKRAVLGWVEKRGMRVGPLGPGPAAPTAGRPREKAPPPRFDHPSA